MNNNDERDYSEESVNRHYLDTCDECGHSWALCVCCGEPITATPYGDPGDVVFKVFRYTWEHCELTEQVVYTRTLVDALWYMQFVVTPDSYPLLGIELIAPDGETVEVNGYVGIVKIVDGEAVFTR